MSDWLLEVEPASGEGFSRAFDRDQVVIGRGVDCDLQLADVRVSRQHSRIFRKDSGLWVEDLGSRNGTRVNGETATAPRALVDGDVIEVSDSRIRLRHRISASARGPLSASSSLGPGTVFRDAMRALPEEPKSGTRESEVEFRRYAEHLRLLNEVHQALAGTLSQEALLDLILDRVFKLLRPEQAAVLLVDGSGQVLHQATRPQGLPVEAVFYSRSLIDEVTRNRVAALVYDAQEDLRFAGSHSMMTSGVRSVLAAPLLSPDGALGVIVLSSQLRIRQFGEADLEMLVPLASAAALHLRNQALVEEAAARRRLEQELALARRIQVALLPERLPELPGYSLLAENLPSRGVSGDLYTAVLRHEATEAVLLVADVSGKGVGASLLGASLEALATGPIEVGQSPREICERVSRRLYQRTPPERYATGFVAALCLASGDLRYTNAGHNPPLLLRASGEVERLPAAGPPLGLLPQGVFGEATVTLQPGDLLVVYTDGVTEATDPEDHEFGLDRLVALCRAQARVPLGEVSRALHRSLEEFARGVPFADDRTLLLLRRDGP